MRVLVHVCAYDVLYVPGCDAAAAEWGRRGLFLMVVCLRCMYVCVCVCLCMYVPRWAVSYCAYDVL